MLGGWGLTRSTTERYRNRIDGRSDNRTTSLANFSTGSSVQREPECSTWWLNYFCAEAHSDVAASRGRSPPAYGRMASVTAWWKRAFTSVGSASIFDFQP